MLPDLLVLDHEQPTETSDHSREETMRRVCVEASQSPVSTTLTKEIWSITIALRPRRMAEEAGMARSQL
eukprot:8274281-Pyramimonas_sp.AAC.1